MLRKVGAQVLEQAADGGAVVAGMRLRASRFDRAAAASKQQAASDGGAASTKHASETAGAEPEPDAPPRGEAAVRGYQAACRGVEAFVRRVPTSHSFDYCVIIRNLPTCLPTYRPPWAGVRAACSRAERLHGTGCGAQRAGASAASSRCERFEPPGASAVRASAVCMTTQDL